MTKGVGKVTRSKGGDSITVKNPKEIITYQQHMSVFYCGNQHRLIGAGFSNVAHIKKWYKKAFLGLTGFSLFKGFTAWNFMVNIQEIPRRGGQPKLRSMKSENFIQYHLRR